MTPLELSCVRAWIAQHNLGPESTLHKLMVHIDELERRILELERLVTRIRNF